MAFCPACRIVNQIGVLHIVSPTTLAYTVVRRAAKVAEVTRDVEAQVGTSACVK
jgi:hypothetical protein